MSEITPITREEKLWNGEDLEPLTREEMYIKRIFDKTQTIPDKPLTRKEILMEKAGEGGGGDVTIKQLSVTANGTYSEKGTAYSPVNVAVPLPENAYLLKTASGSLVSFDDGADLPMPSFICDIDAVQDLHGQDAPWVGGAGKNKFDQDTVYNSYKQSDGSFRITGNSALIIKNYIPQSLVGQQVTVSVYFDLTKETSPTRGIRIICNVGGTETESIRIEENEKKTVSLTFMPTASTDYWYISYGSLGNNYFTFKDCQLEVSSTATSYEPYSNICPISGHTGLDAWVRGKNLLPMTVDGIKAVNTRGTWSGNTYTYNNIDYAIITDTDNNIIGIRITGTTSANSALNLCVIDTSSDMILNGCPTNGSSSTYGLITNVINKSDYGNGVTLTNGSNITPYIRINAGYTCPTAGLMFYPMIRLATETDATYEPYNPNSQTIQVSWQTEAGEVFGGYVDLVSGVLTVTHKSQTGFTRESQDSSNKLYKIGTFFDMTSFSGGGIPPYFIDNMFEKMSLADARAAETPCITQYLRILYVGGYIGKEAELDTLLETLQVKYELETPLTYQLTPTQIKSLLGNNNAWCSTGDVDIDYFAKEV